MESTFIASMSTAAHYLADPRPPVDPTPVVPDLAPDADAQLGTEITDVERSQRATLWDDDPTFDGSLDDPLDSVPF